MAKTRKKSTARKKTNNQGGGSQPLIILIVLALVAASIYGLKYFSDHSEFEPITFEFGSDSAKEDKSVERRFVEEENNESKTELTVSSKQADEPKEEPVAEKEKINPERMVETVKPNEDLPEYNSTDRYYFSKSFDFAWPKYTGEDQIIEHEFYTLKYNEKTEQADWVAYKLTAKNLKNARFKREDDFRPDPEVDTKSAHPDDYKGSGYDRGHLAPAADFTWDEGGLSETFYMSNMSPQDPGFNRGIWRKLEGQVRDWAMSNGEVFVVTGPIYGSRSTKIGKNKVYVPEGYYKVVLELVGQDVKAIAFVLDNEKSSAELYEYALSVDDLETKTGMDFFPSIPDDLENKIESYYDYSAW
ncbi:DNA/RNA non-specific endonuclease [Reichenbachiella ulvae]|uniref:Endonuclease n=1 Tax=Reichenbachiella ulvae TaxID=2980104 RepID=A0ABT3CR05_9BACT|nr:DNA/RNA non-specific endonuclease [Reichenbachiella ulvae]MCV9386140.1 DNA/RNA non-specific endonuclease [Reichenbachiella ulvae]